MSDIRDKFDAAYWADEFDECYSAGGDMDPEKLAAVVERLQVVLDVVERVLKL